MKFYLGVTDNSWYTYLSTIEPEDIYFWQPGGNTSNNLIGNIPAERFCFEFEVKNFCLA